MTPIYPYSLWSHLEYGIVVVITSAVLENKMWEVTLIQRDGSVATIETPKEDWFIKARFICELDEGE